MSSLAPSELNGMEKKFEETFVSPFEKDTWDEAFNILQNIRHIHDAFHGWVEISADIEKLPNGKWRAVRHHAKYA